MKASDLILIKQLLNESKLAVKSTLNTTELLRVVAFNEGLEKAFEQVRLLAEGNIDDEYLAYIKEQQ